MGLQNDKKRNKKKFLKHFQLRKTFGGNKTPNWKPLFS